MEGIRGSDRLTHLHKRQLTEEQLDRIARLADLDGAEVVGWQPRGTTVLEALEARFLIKPDEIGSFMQHVTREQVLARARVLPIGIPWPEYFLAEMEFEAQHPRTAAGEAAEVGQLGG